MVLLDQSSLDFIEFVNSRLIGHHKALDVLLTLVPDQTDFVGFHSFGVNELLLNQLRLLGILTQRSFDSPNVFFVIETQRISFSYEHFLSVQKYVFPAG